MREVLLIFRKDVRHLWPLTVLAAAGIAAITLSDAILPRHMGMQTLPSLAGILPLIAGCYLIVSLLHEEKTVGDTRYWLTRPFPRQALVLSKLLFTLVFLYLPSAAGQMIALAVNGIPLSSYWGSPAADTLFSALTGCIAVSAMAAVTGGMVQFIWATMLWIVAYIGLLLAVDLPEMADWRGFEGTRTAASSAILLLCGVAVVWLMYTRRKRSVATSIVAASAAVVVIGRLVFPWHFAFAVKQHSGGALNGTAVQITYDASGERLKSGLLGFGDRTRLLGLSLPVAISGVPAGMQVVGNRVALSLEYQDERWNSSWEQMGQLMAQRLLFWYGSRQRVSNGPNWLCVTIDPDGYKRLSGVPAHLHARIALTLLGKPYEVRMWQTPVGRRVPGNGFCAVLYRHAALVPSCIWAFADPGPVDLRWRDFPDEPWQFSYEPAPSYSNNGSGIWQGGISIYAHQVASYPRELYLQVRRPVAYFERDLDIPAIRLADFQEARP